MKRTFRYFTRKHFYIFLAFYLLFAGLTLYVLFRQTDSDWRNNWNAAATVGALLGPFTGAIARHLQGCCLEFSLTLFPYCFASLIAGAVLQIVPLPFRSFEASLRLLTWSVGLLGWFAGAVVSFFHAFS